ncbi:MAG: c-type cytochrome [Candidatus Rokuibacteriota bacterium]
MRSGVLAASVAVVLGCATGATMSTADAIKARQDLMKEQSAAMKSIQGKLKAGQAQAIVPDAEKLAATSKKISALFPQGSLNPGTSRAKPEIWQKWADFEGYAKTLETKATQLAATGRTGNAQAATAAAGDLGKTTCGACHNAFRGPEIKK